MPGLALAGAARSKLTVRRIRKMRPLRLLAAGVLVAGGFAAGAPAANASVPRVSKTCRSLNTLNQNLENAFASGDAGHVDSSAVNNVSKSFRKAAKAGPKSLKSAENTIADVAANVSHTNSPAAAAVALKAAGAKLTSALATWGTYIANNCSGATPSTT